MPSFKTLWDQFPVDDAIKASCVLDKGKPFDDYCAIRLSECFIRAGIPLDKFHGKKCWSHKGPRHALLAQDLAKFLLHNAPSDFGPKESIEAQEFQSALADRTGVVFFKDFWRRGSGRTKESVANRSGDHIDLWNKSRITSSSMFMRAVAEFFGAVSDLNQSKEIWFWEVK